MIKGNNYKSLLLVRRKRLTVIKQRILKCSTRQLRNKEIISMESSQDYVNRKRSGRKKCGTKQAY